MHHSDTPTTDYKTKRLSKPNKKLARHNSKCKNSNISKPKRLSKSNKKASLTQLEVQKLAIQPTVAQITATQSKNPKATRTFREGKILRTRYHIAQIQSAEQKQATLQQQCTCIKPTLSGELIPGLPIPAVSTAPAGNIIEQTHIDLLVIGLIYSPLKPTIAKQTLIDI